MDRRNHCKSNLRVQAQRQEHEEEEAGPERRQRQLQNGRRVRQKDQARP